MLSSLLVLQLVIVGILFSSDANMDINNETKSLVNLNNELSNIKIIDGNQELSFSKISGKWRIDNYPALELLDNKVSSLTTELATMQVTWPITSTASSHERFKVTNDNFEKQVYFTDNQGNEQKLLLGKSPSFKKLYARNIDDDDVYSIDYNTYQLSADKNDWLDKSQLAIDSISKISHSVVNLEKSGSDWQLAAPSSLNEQQVLDEEYIEDFINQLTSLAVTGITEEVFEPTNKLTVFDEQDRKFVYSFAAVDDSYYVQRDDIEQWFQLSKSKYEKLAHLSFDQLVSDTLEKKEDESENLSE